MVSIALVSGCCPKPPALIKLPEVKVVPWPQLNIKRYVLDNGKVVGQLDEQDLKSLSNYRYESRGEMTKGKINTDKANELFEQLGN